MNNLPTKLREELAADPYYRFCARADENCAGRITWEHAFEYAGRQIQERWAIIPLCWFHHLGAGLNKTINRQIAVVRATPEDRKRYPRLPWNQYEQCIKRKLL